MRRAAAILALLAAGCTTMEPKYVQPDAAVPASWPVGDPYLAQAEVGLPALTYKQVFTDVRLQTLIAQAIANNRDLRTAAANIAVAREQYRIQRANQLPTVDANGAATLSGDKDKAVSAQYQAGVSVPNFEIDLFGRLRSLTNVQLDRHVATEAGARATRLTLVGNIANAWLDYAAASRLRRLSAQTADSAEKSVTLTRIRLEGDPDSLRIFLDERDVSEEIRGEVAGRGAGPRVLSRAATTVRIKRVPAGGRSTKTFYVARSAIPVPLDGIPFDRIVSSICHPD